MSKPSKEQIANGVATAAVTAKMIECSKSVSSDGYGNEEAMYRRVFEHVIEDLRNNR